MEFIKNNVLFYSLSLVLFASVVYFLSQINQVSLWGDELWTLSKMSLSYSNLLEPRFLWDPNYPTHILFYKTFSYLIGSDNPNILVLGNLINLLFIFCGIRALKQYLTLEQVILFLALLLSSEYFIRMFLELRTYGLTLGLSTLFSSLYIRFYFDRTKLNLILILFTGLLLSTIHPFAGLFVCSTFFTMFFLIKSYQSRIVLSLAIFLPIIFLFLYSSQSLEGLFIRLTFNHIRNTFAFIIPTLLFFLILFYYQYKKGFDQISKYAIIFSPVIISIGIIYLYSFVIHPVYQARYFVTFFPLTCLVLLLGSSQEVEKIKNLIVLSCLISVIFLYGPRSQIPYTNYQSLIIESHHDGCKGAPIFFNNSQPLRMSQFYKDTYHEASKYYSKKHQRILKTYDEIIISIEELKKEFPKCNIFGISGQGEQEVFADSINSDLKRININQRLIVKEIKARKCFKPGCGILFSFTEN